MIEYNEEAIYDIGIVYNVMGIKISFYSEEITEGLSTVADVGGKFHYLWNQIPNIETAVVLWQKLNNKILDVNELNQVMIDNNLQSQAF